MTFQNYLNLGQILVSIVLIVVVLLQAKGAGFGTGLVGGGPSSSFRTRRGLEKTLFQATIVLVIVFLAMSAWSVKAY